MHTYIHMYTHCVLTCTKPGVCITQLHVRLCVCVCVCVYVCMCMNAVCVCTRMFKLGVANASSWPV